jgi:DNA-binding transcriptional ArsR family regulator
MRYLKTHGQATGEELVTKLSMSPDAVTRHTAKLRRRGFLSVKRRQGRRKAFQLAGRYKTPVHREMFRVVVGAWKKAKSRTSRSPRFRSPEIPCPVPAGAHRTIYDRSCSPKEFRRFLMHMGL